MTTDPRDRSKSDRRNAGGPSAVEMLLAPVERGRQDDPELSEEFWYTSNPIQKPASPDESQA